MLKASDTHLQRTLVGPIMMHVEIAMRRAICPMKSFLGILMPDMLCAKIQLPCRYLKLLGLLGCWAATLHCEVYIYKRNLR
jgi:hypothetical protein